MSRKERNRITIMAGVKSQELTQVQAAELMGLGYRQAKRVWRRYQDEGDAGLVHRLRGKAGLRRKPPALRAQVLARYAEACAQMDCREILLQELVPASTKEQCSYGGLWVDGRPIASVTARCLRQFPPQQ